MVCSIPVTADLLSASEDLIGSSNEAEQTILHLAACIDAIAKEYGLSDSSNFAEAPNPLERHPALGIAQTVFSHCFPELSTTSNQPEILRNKITQTLIDVANDPRQRNVVVEGLSRHGLLTLGQVYWNIEEHPQKRKLPIQIQPKGLGRTTLDIPTGSGVDDYAMMKWTERINYGARWEGGKTSGGAMRKAGAKLAILVAQQLLNTAGPLPESTAHPVLEFPQSGKPKARIRWEEPEPTPPHQPPTSADVEVSPRSAALTAFPATRLIVGDGLSDPDPEYQPRGFDALMNQHWAGSRNRRVWLSGAPGLGKTHSAKQVMAASLHDHGENSDRLLIWVDGSDPERVTEVFAEAAVKLALVPANHQETTNLRAQADALLHQLQISDWRWLVVLDNVDANALRKQKLIPTGENPNGRVLLTTLSPATQIAGQGFVLETGLFTHQEADDYLAKRLLYSTGPERAALAETLNLHPLGISIAATTITESYMEIADWISEFQHASQMDEVADSTDRGGYPHALAATWKVALERASHDFPEGIIERVALVLALQDPAGSPSWLWERDRVTYWVYGKSTRHYIRAPKEIQQLQRFGIIEFRGKSWKRVNLVIHQLAARAIRELAGEELCASLAHELSFTWLMQLTEDTRTSKAELRRALAPIASLPKLDSHTRLIAEVLLDRGSPDRPFLSVMQQAVIELAPLLESCGATGQLTLAKQLSFLAREHARPDITAEALKTFQHAIALFDRATSVYGLNDDFMVHALEDKAELEEAFNQLEDSYATRALLLPIYNRQLLSGDISQTGSSLFQLFKVLESQEHDESLTNFNESVDAFVREINNRISALRVIDKQQIYDDLPKSLNRIIDDAEYLRKMQRTAEARHLAQSARSIIAEFELHKSTDSPTDPSSVIALSYIDEKRWEEALLESDGLDPLTRSSLVLRLGNVEEAMEILTNTHSSSERTRKSVRHKKPSEDIEIDFQSFVVSMFDVARITAYTYERFDDLTSILRQEIEYRSRPKNLGLADNEQSVADLNKQLAFYLAESDSHEEAIMHAQRSIESFRLQRDLDPENETVRKSLLHAFQVMDFVYSASNRPKEALETLHDRLTILREQKQITGVNRLVEDEIYTLNRIAAIYLEIENFAELEKALAEGQEIFWLEIESFTEQEKRRLLQNRGETLLNMHNRAGRYKERISEELESILEHFLAIESKSIGGPHSSLETHRFLTRSYRALNRPDETLQTCNVWIAAAREKSRLSDKDSDWEDLLLAIGFLLGAYQLLGNVPAMVDPAEEYITTLERLYSRNPTGYAEQLFTWLPLVAYLYRHQELYTQADHVDTRLGDLLLHHPELGNS